MEDSYIQWIKKHQTQTLRLICPSFIFQVYRNTKRSRVTVYLISTTLKRSSTFECHCKDTNGDDSDGISIPKRHYRERSPEILILWLQADKDDHTMNAEGGWTLFKGRLEWSLPKPEGTFSNRFPNETIHGKLFTLPVFTIVDSPRKALSKSKG